MQLLRDLAAEGVIVLARDAAGVAPHGVGGFEVMDSEAFQRCRMMWFQREAPGVATSSGGAVGRHEQGGGGESCGTERDKESSANQAFRRNGLIPERKAGTRGYDWENGRFWSFDLETFVKYGSSSKLKRQTSACSKHFEPEISAASKDYNRTAMHSSRHADSEREGAYIRIGSSSDPGLASIFDSVHQHGNFVNKSAAGKRTSRTQALESGFQHSSIAGREGPGLQASDCKPFQRELLNSDMISRSACMGEGLMQLQSQLMHESEWEAPFVTAPAHLQIPHRSSEPLHARTPSLAAAPSIASEDEVVPFSITPLISMGHGYGAGPHSLRSADRQSIQWNQVDIHVPLKVQPQVISNQIPLQLQLFDLVAASTCLPQNLQQQLSSQYPCLDTRDVAIFPSRFSSSSRALAHQPLMSLHPSAVPVGIEESDCPYGSRPFRPTPIRPTLELRAQAGYSLQSLQSWSPATFSERTPTHLVSTQDCAALPQASSTDEDEGSQIPVGSLLNSDGS